MDPAVGQSGTIVSTGRREELWHHQQRRMRRQLTLTGSGGMKEEEGRDEHGDNEDAGMTAEVRMLTITSMTMCAHRAVAGDRAYRYGLTLGQCETSQAFPP